MERRWTSRERARLNVDLHFKDRRIDNCVTRDISFGGLFLEVHDAQPPKGAHVDLEFKVKEHGEMISHRLPGKVVRRVDGGIGIVFRNFDAAAFRALREIYRCKDETEALAS